MLETCAQCTTRYAVGLGRCPHCGSAEKVAEGAESAAEATTDGGGAQPKTRSTKARAQAAEAVGEAGL